MMWRVEETWEGNIPLYMWPRLGFKVGCKNKGLFLGRNKPK